jgi:hypothetical protein
MRPILLAVCLAALPAHADPAADFQRLTQTFPTLGFDYDAEAQLQQAKTFVAGMTGTWVQLGPLMVADGGQFPDAERLASLCEKTGFAAKPTGMVSFDLVQPGKTTPFTIHLQWIGGPTFLSRYDEAGWLARVFGDNLENIPAQVLVSSLTQTAWNGSLTLIPVGDDLIYMQAPQAPADVLARCPE